MNSIIKNPTPLNFPWSDFHFSNKFSLGCNKRQHVGSQLQIANIKKILQHIFMK